MLFKEPQAFVHGTRLIKKAQHDQTLGRVVRAYNEWRRASLAVEGRGRKDIDELVELLNSYKNAVEPILDERDNTAQEVLVSSILEEFFEYVFCGIDAMFGKQVLRRPDKSFIQLSFNPKDLESLVTHPEYTIRRKDQDFVIGTTVRLSLRVGGGKPYADEQIVVPAVALECKRYLERNMLDECSGTAEKVKSATPYCMFIVVAEYLKMDDCRPELSRIDEIYILRKQRNSDRLATDFTPKPIDSGLVWDLFERVLKHLSRIWWDAESALKTGKLFNY